MSESDLSEVTSGEDLCLQQRLLKVARDFPETTCLCGAYCIGPILHAVTFFLTFMVELRIGGVRRNFW